MILFVSDVCPWCDVVLEKLQEINESIPIEIKEINIEDPKWKDIVRKYMISGVPTLLMFTGPDKFKKYVGIPEDDELVKMVMMASISGSTVDIK